MKTRKFIKLFLLILIIMMSFTMISCGDSNTESTPTPNENSIINGVKFESITVTYNGEEHSIYCKNLPEGVKAYYSGNGVTEVGTHTVKVSLYDSENNLLKTLQATITINPAATVPTEPIDVSGVTFEGIEVHYDGNKYSVFCENIPADVTVTYEGNGVSEIGTHKVTATLKDKKGNVLSTLDATIIIHSPICGICEGTGIVQEHTYPELANYTPTSFDVSSLSVDTVQITQGVWQHTYTYNLKNGNKVQVVVMEVDLNYAGIAAGTKDNTTSFTGSSSFKSTPYKMATAYEQANPGTTVLAAANADFFGTYPVNAFVKDGVIMKEGHNDNGGYDYTNLNNDIPASKPMLFGVSGNVAQIKPIIQDGSIKETIQSKLSYSLCVTSKGVTEYISSNYVVNSYNGERTKINLIENKSRETTVPSDSLLLTLKRHDLVGEEVHGEVIEIETITTTTKVRPTKDTYYISIPTSFNMNFFKVGDIISRQVSSEDDTWTGYNTIIGCRQALVIDGEIASTVTKENSNGAQTTNIPRTAIGIMQNGHVALFSVEALRYGKKSTSSDDPYGLNLPQLADFMRYVGVVDGANFDGGGSTQLITRNTPLSDFKVVVRSSDYGTSNLNDTRSVINAIMIYVKNEE